MPFDFAVSGLPSPFVDFSDPAPIFVECFVSVFDIPPCLTVMSPCDLPLGLLAEVCDRRVSKFSEFVSHVAIVEDVQLQ